MPTLRTIGCHTLLVLAVAGWTHIGARKEFLRLNVRSASGAPVGVRLQTRGIVVIPNHSTGRLPETLDTTFVTPAVITLGGVGDADLEVTTAGATLAVDAAQLRPNAPPAERLTGTTFRISHGTYAEPYHIVALERAHVPGK